jgi:toluene monooxygenase electron transfer component
LVEFIYKISIEDGAVFEVKDGDSIMQAALRSGIGFPYGCSSGSCCSCKYELIDGEVIDTKRGFSALSIRDRKKNRHLGCQSFPKGPSQIRVRTEQKYIPKYKPEKYIAVLVDRKTITHDMSELIFKTDGHAKFISGQYILLSLPNIKDTRAYSMSNISNNDGQWEFHVKQVKGGKFSNALLSSLSLGSKVNIDGPFGQAFVRTDNNRDVVCVAGGSGLGPMLSIVRHLANEPSANIRKIYFFFGGRQPVDMICNKYIQPYAKYFSELTIYNSVSERSKNNLDNWSGSFGFIHELVDKVLNVRAPEYEFYTAGPPEMNDSLVRLLQLNRNVPFEQIHYDSFF